MDISLRTMEWRLKGFWPWVPMLRNSMETGMELLGVTDWIPATVPGGVHYDLFRAGLIDNPYIDRNSLHSEWVENRWWVYKTEFPKPACTGEKVELVCKGLDYEAFVYMNGIRLGEHRGMYHPAVFDVTEILTSRDTVELIIVLAHAPDEMGQIGKTSMTFTQKSRFNYKWDFSTRLVNLGLWDDVVLRVHSSHSIGPAYIRTDVEDGEGIVSVSASVESKSGGPNRPAACTVTLTTPQGELIGRETAAVSDAVEVRFRVPSPELWYPNGFGDQPLYEVRLTLTDGAATLDEKSYKVGIRSLRYEKNEGSPEDALPYTFVVNGKKVYIKGVNLTPLDHLYGNIGLKRYDWIVRLAKFANVNMIRIWGGGIIEKPEFYELCDRYGIMVWQEFIQSSSGVDNIPSKRPEFLELLERTAVAALCDRRNYTSLTVWSGGNELMSDVRVPSTAEDENLAMLGRLVETHDPQRLFLPTSASGPVEHITRKKGVSHDVHGWWKYEGNPNHYELYGEADNLFHSEFGVDGASATKSLRKFLSKEHLAPTSMEDSLTWRHRGEWWDTYARNLRMFGSVSDLDTFVECSQWMQAEGLRFILEANRRRKFRNSGSIIWQLNEPWPNISCTNLVDYYGETKMAYHFARKAFSPDHVSLDYRRLDYRPGERFEGGVYVHRAGGSSAVSVTAEVLDARGRVIYEKQYEGVTKEDHALEIGALEFDVPPLEEELFFVRLKGRAQRSDAEVSSNLYVFSTREEAVYAPALQLDGARLDVGALEEWSGGKGAAERTRRYRVANEGTTVALHVYPEVAGDRYWAVADGAYESLFPGDSVVITVTCIAREGGPFDSLAESTESDIPSVAFKSFHAQQHVLI
ncbi:glycoside hydrolase family 2 protein [Paenibacillus antri]|nr:glycoside hydrolase family 2 TIM barrel-domain containing protein [Paenibacillus antri]